MSFTSSGQIFFTDSGEGGEAGYAPFTDGRGAWRCLGGGKARSTTLDFTLPAAGDSKPRIGRLDMNFSYDAKTKTITGTGVLYFVPLTADPMQPSELKDGRDFRTDRRARGSALGEGATPHLATGHGTKHAAYDTRQ
jgi:hypothetical protein